MHVCVCVIVYMCAFQNDSLELEHRFALDRYIIRVGSPTWGSTLKGRATRSWLVVP